MANQIPIKAATLQSGCFIQLSHKLNHDGYFRKNFKNGKAELFHRLMWQHFNGEVPKGKELHHKCHNRACFNPEHLELVDISYHKTFSNEARYAKREQQAYECWKEHQCTGTKLGQLFGVSYSAACRWIRRWRQSNE